MLSFSHLSYLFFLFQIITILNANQSETAIKDTENKTQTEIKQMHKQFEYRPVLQFPEDDQGGHYYLSLDNIADTLLSRAQTQEQILAGSLNTHTNRLQHIVMRKSPLGRVEKWYLPNSDIIQSKDYYNKKGVLKRRSVYRFSGKPSDPFEYFQDLFLPDGSIQRQSATLTLIRYPEWLNPQQPKQLLTVDSKYFHRVESWSPEGRIVDITLRIKGWRRLEKHYVYHPVQIKSDFPNIQSEKIALYEDFEGPNVSEHEPIVVLNFSNTFNELGNVKESFLNGKLIVKYFYDKKSRPILAEFPQTGDFLTLGFETCPQGRREVSYLSCVGTDAIENEWVFNDNEMIVSEKMTLSKSGNLLAKRFKKKYIYNEHDQISNEIWEGSRPQDPHRHEKYNYEKDGWLQSRFIYNTLNGVKDPQIKITSLDRVSNDQWLYLKPDQKPSTIRLDDEGRIIELEKRKFKYGPLGRVTEVINPEGESFFYEYFESGSRLLKKNSKGKILEGYLGLLKIQDSNINYPIRIQGHFVGYLNGENFKPVLRDRLGSSYENFDQLTDAFGRPFDDQEPAKGSTFRGHPWDPDLGAYNFNFRDYHPGLGLFLTPNGNLLENMEGDSQDPPFRALSIPELYSFNKGRITYQITPNY